MPSSNSRRTFVKAAMSAPYLTRDEERDLAIEWRSRQDEAALHRLTAAHMRLVVSIAARFRHFGLPMADLIQEGHVGLLEAAARFEPERDVRFSTYATWWIRASVQDYILRNWSIVRGGTSSAQKALFFNLRRLRAKLMQEDATLTEDEVFGTIASTVGVSKDDVVTMSARLSAPDTSLNVPLGEAEGGAAAERQDFLVCDGALPDEVVSGSIDMRRRLDWLRQAMTCLSERELHIVQERRLMDEGATLESLGETMGISKERVRQIETRALEKLKKALLQLQPQGRAAFV